jgi:uncharacterized protein YjbI with pentapeptide repeats
MGMKIEDRATCEEQGFDNLEFRRKTIRSSAFELCRFLSCDFSETEFINCKFSACVFKDSNLNVVKLDGTRFTDTEFKDCKTTGINWTSLDWKSVALSAPLHFESCDISFSVFSGLTLPGLQLTRCKAHDVDFSECDLSDGNFSETDLANARFNLCRLDRCDFRDAINYSIDPLVNTIEGASFSVPDVLGLLSPFKIRIHDRDE